MIVCCWLLVRNNLQLVFFRGKKIHYLVIKIDASPCVYGSIFFLTFCQHVSLPIGESLALANLLAEKIGIKFLKTLVDDSQIAYYVLNVNKPSRLKLFTAMERHKVVVP